MTAKAGGLLQIGRFEPEIRSRLDDLEHAPGRAGGIRALAARNPK